MHIYQSTVYAFFQMEGKYCISVCGMFVCDCVFLYVSICMCVFVCVFLLAAVWSTVGAPCSLQARCLSSLLLCFPELCRLFDLRTSCEYVFSDSAYVFFFFLPAS